MLSVPRNQISETFGGRAIRSRTRWNMELASHEKYASVDLSTQCSSVVYKHSAHVPGCLSGCCIDCTVYTSNLCVPVPWRRLIKAFCFLPPAAALNSMPASRPIRRTSWRVLRGRILRRRWCEFVELNHVPVFCCFVGVLFFLLLQLHAFHFS